MITTLPIVDVSGMAVGDAKTVDWSNLIHSPPLGYSNGSPSVTVYNESGVGFSIQLQQARSTFFVPAGGWLPILNLSPTETGLVATAVYTMQNAPVTKLVVVYFDHESPNTGPGILGNSPIGVSGGVNTSLTQVVQDGQPNGQTLVEATPTGQPQNVLITTDGAALFTRVTDVVPVTPSQTAAVYGGVTFGGAAAVSGDATAGSATFDGSTGYVFGPPTSLQTGNGAWTVECLVKFAANPSVDYLLMFFGTIGSGKCVQMYVNSIGKLQCDTNGGTAAASGAALSLNAWHHVAGTYDGTTIRCYVDGTLQATTGANGVLNLTAGLCQLGVQNSSALFLNGSLAEAAFYTTALSGARISAHFTAVSGGGYAAAVAADSPVRYYRLNEASNATWANSTISSSLATVGRDASSILGRVAALGGQATAGVLGVPVIVGQVLNAVVTATTQQTLLSVTPAADGLYCAAASLVYANGSNSSVTLWVSYADPITGGNPKAIFNTGSGRLNALAFVASAGNALSCDMLSFYAQGGHPFLVQFTDNAGTPSDHITVTIWRVS